MFSTANEKYEINNLCMIVRKCVWKNIAKVKHNLQSIDYLKLNSVHLRAFCIYIPMDKDILKTFLS